MKYWMWSAFVFIITAAVMLIFKLSLLTFLLLGAPVLIIVLIYGFFIFSFRDSLKPEPVPTHGYNSRLSALDAEIENLKTHNFQKFDQFYLKMIPDSVTYAFRHNTEPIFFCLYHFGKKMACDVVSVFDNDFALTTSNVIESGATPRPVKDFIQIFPGVSYYELWMQHEKSHKFLKDKGLKPLEIHDGDFRFYFMKSLRDQSAYIRKIDFWPVVLLLGTVTRRGKLYCKSIIDQYSQGSIKIFQ